MLTYIPLINTMNREKVSVRQLAKLSGVNVVTICDMRNGRSVRTNAVEKICRALKCGVDDVVAWVPDGFVDKGAEYENCDVDLSPLQKKLSELKVGHRRFCVDAGVEVNLIPKIMAGFKPSVNTLRKLASALNCKPTELYRVREKDV